MNKPQSIEARPFYSFDISLIIFGCLIALSAVGIDASNQGRLFGLNQKAQIELEGMLVILFFIGLSGFAVDIIYRVLSQLKKLLPQQS